MESCGAEIYLADTPILDISVEDKECFNKLHDLEEQEMGIKYITNADKYFLIIHICMIRLIIVTILNKKKRLYYCRSIY